MVAPTVPIFPELLTTVYVFF